MNLVYYRTNLSSARPIHFSARFIIFSLLLLTLIPAGIAGTAVYWWIETKEKQYQETTNQLLQAELEAQKAEVARIQQQSVNRVDALTPKIGELQARLIRLDALGQRLISVANLDDEFDFDQPPPQGGPETNLDDANYNTYTDSELNQAIELLTNKIEQRQQQLELIHSLLTKRNYAEQVYIAGRPIKKGWMSSPYGRRSDPFTGRTAWHGGIDFAGQQGSEIIATGAGVVVFAASRSGYGKLVEIDHGGGYITRYAHLHSYEVKKGDLVQRGETVGLMGCTGRCTGPHVHYEILLHGKNINPTKYVSRSAP